MFRITENLATHGLGEKGYYPLRYVDADVGYILDFRVVDVRTLLDEPGNTKAEYALNILRATSWLEVGEKVVVCCGAGQSRSNAIALGVLVKHFKMDFYTAWELVKEKVPIAQIEPCHIEALKKLFKVTLP